MAEPAASQNGADVAAMAVVAEAAARLLGLDGAAVERLPGGGNNKLFRLAGAAGEEIVAKQYFRQASDSRDRLGAEYGGLDFLWRCGERQIAQPLASDHALGIAFYEHIPGAPALAQATGSADVREAADFLIRLRGLAGAPGANELPEASEAGFCLADLVAILHLRLDRLGQVAPDSQIGEACCAFRDTRLAPAVARIAESAAARREAAGHAADAPLAPALRTLSPSDFGFHNAIRRVDGKLIFVDFEYFGWDDPAKTISDFLLHPAMALSPAQGEEFVALCLDAFNDDDLPARLRAFYPLFGLKWTAILLNEFLPGGWSRRLFSGVDAAEERAYLRGQLDKAERYLEAAIGADDEFPYAA